MQVRHRPYTTAGVGLVGASIIAVTPMTVPVPGIHVPDIQLATSDQDIVIEIVRHGQRMPPQDLEDTQSPPYPGVPLSELGHQQAQDVGEQLHKDLGDQVAGIFSGQGIRDQQTAWPFADLEGVDHDQVQILPGLNEVDPGIYGSDPQISPGTLIYVFTTLLWTAGYELAQIPGSADFNGVVFDEKFTDAVDTMYNAAMDNPVVSDNGHITDVAFNNEESIVDWVLMNVKNPDLGVILSTLFQSLSSPAPGFLPDGGVVQVEGSPTDGWTLVSWNGDPVPQDPGLSTELFVDFRDLIQAPQTALWNIFQALLGGDATTIENALQTGFNQVGDAIVQFPQSVINDIVGALSNFGTDTGGQAAGETVTTLGDAFAPSI
jgi:hypothetical protein